MVYYCKYTIIWYNCRHISDIVGLVPDGHNKVNIAIKSRVNFGFLIHIEVMFTSPVGCWGYSSILSKKSMYISSVQSLSWVELFAIPWTAAHQASLSFTTSQSLLKLVSIESVMPSNRLILCRPLLLLPLICPHIRVFPHESALCIRWPKY